MHPALMIAVMESATARSLAEPGTPGSVPLSSRDAAVSAVWR